MIKHFSIALMICAVTAFAPACQKTEQANMNMSANDNMNMNGNAGNTVATTATRTGPDNSEITTTTDASGVKTETRVFRDNPRVSKVVVTTHNGTSTVRAYSPSGEEKELKKNEPEDALEATGKAIADAAGFVGDKAEDVAGEAKEGTKKVGEKTADTAKTVGNKTVDTTKKVGEKTADTAKTIGEKTAEGAKKTGKAIKKVVTP